MGTTIRSLAPIASPDARVLILGSMPGVKSLETQQYYAHPQNAFWRIMGELVGARRDKPYEERSRLLKANGVALWDVLRSCVRPGSLDANITDAEPNDFVDFFAAHRDIRVVGLNGGTAAKIFHRRASASLPAGVVAVQLPSSSAAHARMRFEEKCAIWRGALRFRT
jgi:double-stranded uracil-DNA glycosylase